MLGSVKCLLSLTVGGISNPIGISLFLSSLLTLGFLKCSSEEDFLWSTFSYDPLKSYYPTFSLHSKLYQGPESEQVLRNGRFAVVLGLNLLYSSCVSERDPHGCFPIDTAAISSVGDGARGCSGSHVLRWVKSLVMR